MDKKLAKIVQDECVAALEAVAAKHGFNVRQHGGTLSDISMILKFEFKVADRNRLLQAEQDEFHRYAYLFGLEPRDYGAIFTANGKKYTVVGFDLKRRKYPILVEDATGKRTCFTEMVVDRIKAARKVSA